MSQPSDWFLYISKVWGAGCGGLHKSCYEYMSTGVGGDTAGGTSKIPSNNTLYLLRGLQRHLDCLFAVTGM
jgi:hypothetical protein